MYQGQVESTSYIDPYATVHLLIGGAGNDEMHDSVRRNRRRLQQSQLTGTNPRGGHQQMHAAAAAAEEEEEDKHEEEEEEGGGVEYDSWKDPSKAVTEAANARMYLSPPRRDESEGGRARGWADWVALKDEGHYGAGLVTIANETHLHFEYVHTTSKQVFDDFWLVKHRNGK